jgi:hypothetical protein
VSTIVRAQTAPVAAVVLGVVTLGLGLAQAPLNSLSHQPGTGGPVAGTLSIAAAVVPAAAVGTLLAARRPRNPIGWMILALVVLGFSPTGQYLILDYRIHHGTLPLGQLAVVLNECWPVFLVLIATLLWVFPDGTLPAGRWRRPAAVLMAGWLLLGLAASAPGLVVAAGGRIQVTADGDVANLPGGAWPVLESMVIAGALASWLAWLVVQVPAYRRSSGERRQQLKWLYSGGAVFLLAMFITVFMVPVAMGQTPGYGTQPVANDLGPLASGALPVCLGVAVLKYRLYQIDRIISRVISYAIITAVLAGVFAGLVVLATQVLPVKTPVAVAASTLAAAALFNPLRRPVQHAVDRRFNRSRYDAETVVAVFSARLRHTVDLDTVRGDLVGVVHEAFQPAHVSVWLTTRAAAPVPTSTGSAAPRV